MSNDYNACNDIVDVSFHERDIKVVAGCTKEYLNEKDVKFENIEEDIQGRDVLTFTCPLCKEIHRSYRLVRLG